VSVHAERETAPFFAISATRLLAGSLVTGGLFDYWWAYRSWRHLEAVTGQPKVPIVQAVALGLSNYFLSARVHRVLGRQGLVANLNRFGLPTAYFLLALLWRFSDTGWFLSSLAAFPLAAFQHRIIQANIQAVGAPHVEPRFTRGATLFLIVGAILFGLSTYDILVGTGPIL
jgi:hypothetical protein